MKTTYTKAVERRSRIIRLAEERRHILGNNIGSKLNDRCDASYLFPFYKNFSFLFGDVVAFYELLPRRSLLGHQFREQKYETFISKRNCWKVSSRAWMKWKTNKFPDRKKKQNKTKGVPSVIKSSCQCYSDLMYTIRRIWIILGNHQIYTNRSYYMLCIL